MSGWSASFGHSSRRSWGPWLSFGSLSGEGGAECALPKFLCALCVVTEDGAADGELEGLNGPSRAAFAAPSVFVGGEGARPLGLSTRRVAKRLPEVEVEVRTVV